MKNLRRLRLFDSLLGVSLFLSVGLVLSPNPAAAQAQGASSTPTVQGAGKLPLVLDWSQYRRDLFVKDGKTNAMFQTVVGRQIFDGLPFQVDGHASLYGSQQALRSSGQFPDFTGIRVGCAFEELHLIHATQWADVEDETIAQVRLNYADGSKHEFPIQYGRHLRDWQRLRSEEKELLTDPNTKVIWRGPGIADYKATSRLFKTVLVNPHPEKVVTTIDAVSTRHLASYDLYAATVARRDPSRAVTPAVPLGEPERHFDGAVVVHVTAEADNQPIAHALVDPGMTVDETGVITAPVYTSAAGEAIVRYPSGRTTALYVSVEKHGYATGRANANLDAGLTNHIELQLHKVPKVHGVVRRPDGQPAAGLEVRIVGVFSGQRTLPKTDAEGKFDVPFSPEQFGDSQRTYCLLIRDVEHNLAVAQDLDEEGGPLDLRLVPAMTLIGHAELDGKPITNATAALVFWTGNTGFHLQGLAVGTNTPGRFELPTLPPGRRYGLYVSAPGFGQQYVNGVEASEDSKRVELDPVELKPANLKLAGQVVDADEKPVTNATVFLNGQGQPNANTQTDREGRFSFAQVCEGSVSLYANANSSSGNISAEAGDTNVVLKLGESSSFSPSSTARKLKGVVTGPDGKPVAGAEVCVFPSPSARVKTGADGAFSLNWRVESWQLDSGGDPSLVVRDLAHNLAAAEDLAEGTTNVNVQLKPAWTVTGRVVGPDSVPLTNAQVGVWLLACRTFSQLSEQLATTDAQGKFTLKTLPPGPKYTVYATAKGYGRRQQELDADITTNSVELTAFELKPANKVIAGKVINPMDKPVAGVNVSLSGEGQPDGYVTTDSKGLFTFKVCDGQLRLFASSQNGYANTTAEAGDTNIVIQLNGPGNMSSSARSTPKRASLIGKPLPDLAGFGLSADAVPAGKPLLLCLADAEQRPSRRALRLVAEKCPSLTQQGFAVLAIQAAVTTADALQSVTNDNPLPFPLGRVAEKTPATRWATDVESLPWLILRDAKGNVIAEGFSLDDLDAKLESLKKPGQN